MDAHAQSFHRLYDVSHTNIYNITDPCLATINVYGSLCSCMSINTCTLEQQIVVLVYIIIYIYRHYGVSEAFYITCTN